MASLKTALRGAGWVVLAVAIAVGAVAVRRNVYVAQKALTPDGRVPFTLESALAFRRVELAYRDGALPERDRAVGWPEGIKTRETDSSGAELALAAAAHRWPGTMPLSEKVRWLVVVWFCALSTGGLFCLVKWSGGGWGGGAVAAAFYAVAISAVARSTGQELSHENDALPLVIWGLAFMARLWRKGEEGKRGAALAGWASAVALAGALCLWDLVQYALGLVAAAMLVPALAGRLGRRRWLHGAMPLAVCLTAVAAGNPYLRAHGFWGSPVFGAVWATVLAGVPVVQRGRWWERVGTAATVLGMTFGAGALFASSYSHFGALLAAKLRFLNQRPDNPALLTFEQRILWAPALNSTSWMSVWEWFPTLLALSAAAVLGGVLARRRREAGDGGFFVFLAWGWGVSLAAFILFFRFHAWLAVFACAAVGWTAGVLWGRAGGWGKAWLALVVLAAWGVELSQPCIKPLRWGRPYTYPKEAAALMEHLRRYVAPEPVAANFGASGAIAAYGGCPVVLHPKFETPGIRQDVEEYGKALFRGTEKDFKKWMECKGATVYVHCMGEFSDVQPGLQMRYMVDALNPPKNAAARLFEQRPEELKYFVPQFANIKYRVYRLKEGPAVNAAADRLAARAKEAFQEGRLTAASLWAAHALRLLPDHAVARETLRHASSLAAAGVMAEDEDDALADDPEFPLDEDGLAPEIAPVLPPWGDGAEEGEVVP